MVTSRSRWGILSAALLVSALVAGVSQAAVDPSDKCEGGKNEAAGKYAACMSKAEKSFVLGSSVGDYEAAQLKCSDKFAKSWEKFEDPAACPSMGDETEIRDFVDSCVQSVAEALSGGTLPEDIVTCLADLATCDADLAGAQGDLDTCNGDLAAAQGDLTTCNDDLGLCNSDLAATQGDLDTCNGDLAAAQGDLDTCNVDLSAAQGDLVTCNDDLGLCNGDLAAAQGNLDTCNGDLAASQVDLATCNNDLGLCNGDLAAAQGDLDICNGDLAAAQGGLDICNGDLAAAQVDLATCNDDLGVCNGDLATIQGDLVICNDDLAVCGSDLVACLAAPSGQPLKSGQTTCYDVAGAPILCAGTGQDAETQPGLVKSWTDNGDGTVTDDQTSLMWEKLSDNGSIHDKDTSYTWTTAVSTKIATLNSTLFAGHGDWRLPTIVELQTLTDFGRTNPSIDPTTFNTGCASGCTGVACSCTRNATYWSSTTYEPGPTSAWCVQATTGGIGGFNKTSSLYVRAVRNAS